MEPRIQYAKTKDGVSIAYYGIGSGQPLIICPFGPLSHLQLELQMAEIRDMNEYLGRGRMLVRYDNRGFGLSDRDADDFSLDAFVSDLSSVVDGLHFEEIQLITSGFSAMVGIAYAARHPGQVSHLGIAGGLARPVDFPWDPWESIWDLAKKNWPMACDATAALLWRADIAPERASMLKEEVTPQAYISFWEQLRNWDVSNELAEVRAKTLVVAWAGHRGQAQRLAAAIPGARLTPNEAPALTGWNIDLVAEFDAFLREGVQQDEEPVGGLPSGTAVILFADIAGSTALTERMGDAAFRAAARALDERLRAAIREAGGTPAEGKVLGDGVMAVFTSAREAIDAALRCHALSAESELRLHLGIHAGDVIREEHNVYGGAVNVAARVCALSSPGEVLVSATVRDLARTSAGVTFEDRGEREMKGVGEPVRVYAVAWEQQ
ncbi:MAG: hypothetical protein A2148_03540 [Chloroflexi bacterium RBG_16_68_14]|nr:MAG: hypothetical protein A2148_03540 [Chloroflexi bacterium RBG_16_68_14]